MQTPRHADRGVLRRAQAHVLHRPSSRAFIRSHFSLLASATNRTPYSQGSADSLASATETPAQHRGVNDDGDEDEEQVVQMATIAGRQSISKAFTRRLSRSRTATRSRDVLDALVIGVSVEEATVEHEHDEEEAGGSRPGTSMAYAQGALKARGSRGNMNAGAEKEKGEKGGWIGRARGLTQKIRRRSMVALAQSSNSSASR